MSLTDAIDDVIAWIPRLLKLLPVFKDLWSAVRADNTNQVFAAQLEMVRQMREQQAAEEFLPVADDEP